MSCCQKAIFYQSCHDMSTNSHTNEGCRSSLCSTLAPKLYALTKNPMVRWLLRGWVMKMEGTAVYSLTSRIVIVIRLVMARPVVFRINHQQLDIFHG
jgi:hypothetical protein